MPSSASLTEPTSICGQVAIHSIYWVNSILGFLYLLDVLEME